MLRKNIIKINVDLHSPELDNESIEQLSQPLAQELNNSDEVEQVKLVIDSHPLGEPEYSGAFSGNSLARRFSLERRTFSFAKASLAKSQMSFEVAVNRKALKIKVTNHQA